MPKWMLIAVVLGAGFGSVFPEQAASIEVVSNIFLRLIKSVIAPVLFGVIVSAIATSPSLAEVGRIGMRSAIYFEVVTTIALALGWFAVWLFRPGEGIHFTAEATSVATPTFSQVIEASFPSSIFDAMARGDVLQIVVFSMLFGAACQSVGREKAASVAAFAEAIREIAFRYTHYVMYLAPFAVFAAMAVTVAKTGADSLRALALFVVASWAAQLTYLLLVQMGSLWLAGAPIGRFIQYAREPFLIAFATTSSAAAVPKTLENMQLFGVPARIVGLVTPISLTFNMSGSCIHLAMCAFFVAQAAGMQMSLSTTLLILLTLKLTSKGVAGIPRANFVILTGLFANFGLPGEGLTVLLGIDALIDMIRTSVNVTGHCVASPVIARWEEANAQSPLQ